MRNMQSQKRRARGEGRLYREVKSALAKELENWEKKYIYSNKEEKEFRINQMVKEVQNMRAQGKEPDIRQAWRTQANALSRNEYEGTRRELFKIFKEDKHQVYNKLNTYLYRLGYSIAEYWNDSNNSDITVNGSVVTMTLDLPKKYYGRIKYEMLIFAIDYSDSRGVVKCDLIKSLDSK